MKFHSSVSRLVVPALPPLRLWLPPTLAALALNAVHADGTNTNAPVAGEPHVMDRTVITGTPLSRTLFELATPVSVLADQELAIRTQSTLGETVANLPGVSSTYYGPNASRPVIRGLDGDHIRVLENGIGLIDASATSVDHAVSSDPLTIRRVEVVRGPATLLYGSSAVGGVVNVINNRIPDQAILVPVTGAIEGRYGSADDQKSGSGLIEGGAGHFAYHLDGFTRSTSDLRIPDFARSERLRVSDPLPPGTAEARDFLPNSASQSDGGAGGVSYVWDKGHVGASFSGFNSAYGTVAEPDVTIRLHQRRVDVAGEIDAPSESINAIKFKLGLSDYRHTEYEGADPGTVFNNRGYDGRVELLHAQLGRFEGAVGFQTQRSDFSALGEEAFLPPTSTLVNSAFVFEEVNFDPVRFQFGGRFDYQTVDADADPAFGPAASRDFLTGSGSAGIVYTFLEHYAAALSVAYTQRAPNYQELYANGPHLATDAFEVGDRTLGAEDSLGLDFSLRRKEGPVTGSIGAFYNRFERFIALAPTGVTDPTFNVPVYDYTGVPAEFYGTEAELVFHLIDTAVRKVHFDMRADWLEARNRVTGEPLPRISPLRYGAGVTYDEGGFTARLETLRYEPQSRVAVGETPTDGYTQLNASVSYSTPVGHTTLTLFVRGTNLLNEDERNHVSFLKDLAPLAGRGALIGAQLKF
ncbi:MAG TPA: TonB-dependent receptor [Candidatus Limnocylindria bacterium]|nr:TonB-dependent receptor [Candidatus Limnocylindria bacterium]